MHSENTESAPSTAAVGTSDAEPQQRLCAEIVRDDGDWAAVPGVEDAVQQAVAAVAAANELDFEAASLCVALSSNVNVAALNATYRGKNKPTNVLSFPALDSFAADGDIPRNLGDIVLAAETVLAEARDQSIEPAAHIKHLVIHGVLHLLGFDHENDDDAEKMEALEVAILARLGIANPYADPPDAGAVHVQHD
jgi:probable rRNA maturation factor